MTEAELIAKAQQGDEDAFARLLDAHQGKVYGLTLRLTLAGEDAAQTGIRYGQACAYVYSGLALVQGLMRVRKVGKIQITPDFSAQAPGSDYFFSFCLKLRAGSLLRAALRILFRFLLRTLKRDKPPAEKQSV